MPPELLELAALLVSDADRPDRFGPPRVAPPDALPSARLLAFLGRTVAADPGCIRAG